MSGFTKLFGSILESTVWETPPTTRIVWITMLAMSDQDGVVEASIPGLAKRAGVSIADCESALRLFASPDPYSRSKELDGRRIVEIDGGWLLVNYEKYRRKLDKEEQRIKAAERQRRKRERDRNASRPVTESHACHASHAESQEVRQAEAEAEAEKRDTSTSAAPKVDQALVVAVYDHWLQKLGKDPGRTKLTGKRRRRIEARLREGYSVSDLCEAIDGCSKSPFHQGENDQGRKYDDIELICRDGAKVEQFRDLGKVTRLPSPKEPEWRLAY